MKLAVAMALCVACGGDVVASPDSGVCTDTTVSTGCPCTAEAGSVDMLDGGACVCAVLSGCMGTRWACYDLPAGCPATLPASYSACSGNLHCDYPQSNGNATEVLCDGTKWNPATVTTYCQ